MKRDGCSCYFLNRSFIKLMGRILLQNLPPEKKIEILKDYYEIYVNEKLR